MKLLIIVTTFFLSSCATVEVDKTYHGSDAGYALISLDLDVGKGAEVYNHHQTAGLMYSSKDSEKEWGEELIKVATFNKEPTQNAILIESENQLSKVALIPLKPGDYWISYYLAGKIDRQYLIDKHVYVPFTIKPNQVSYLGNYHAIETWERRLLVLRLPIGAYFIVKDAREKDIQQAKALNPNVDFQHINSYIPKLETKLGPRLVNQRTTKFDEE